MEYNINDEKNEDTQDLFTDKIQINNKARITIYIILVLISTFSSCDGGIIPQQTKGIKLDFENIEISENSTETDNIEDSKVGFFGSSDYIGRVFGALIFTVIMGKYNRKILLVSTLIFKALTLIIALFTKSFYINVIARILSGISQVFFTTYFPVWCDQYGKENKRVIMVSMIQLGNPLGIIIGYGLNSFCKLFESYQYRAWRISFGIEGIILIVSGFFIFSFKNFYFSQNFVLINDNEGKEESKSDTTNNSLFTNIFKILCNKIFLFTTLSNSVAFFGMGVVQYWGDKYMEKVLNMNDRFFAFAGLCLLGPILGIVFGGYVCDKLGGYQKRNSMVFIIIIMIVSSIISSLIAIHKIKSLFIILTGSYLLFLCAAMPPESGIIISSLENNLRGDGFALSNCLLNLLGSFPSSYVFSIISDIFNQNLSKEKVDQYEYYRYAWMISMLYNLIGLLFIIIAGISRFKIKGDLSKGESEKNEEKEEEFFKQMI